MRKTLFLIVCLLLAAPLLSAQETTTPPAAANDAAQETRRQRLTELSSSIAEVVGQIRGTPFKHPVETNFISRQDLGPRLLKDIEEDYPDERIRNDEAFLKTIGALPDDTKLKDVMIDVLVGQVAGFYDPKDKHFYIVEEVAATSRELELAVIIAHELTHALDDQNHDLKKLSDETMYDEDRAFATSSMFEGSATALMIVYQIQEAANHTGGPMDMGGAGQAPDDSVTKLLASPKYFHTLIARYTVGMAFVQYGVTKETEGTPGERQARTIAKLAADPADSSEQILHPEKYWEADRRDEPIVVDSEAFAKLLKKVKLETVHEQTAGELLCSLVADNSRLSPVMTNQWSNAAGKGWGGDRFFLMKAEKEGGPQPAVWVTVWDTPGDREEFIERYTQVRGETTWVPAGDNAVVFLYNLSAEQIEKLNELLTDKPLKLTRGGAPWTP